MRKRPTYFELVRSGLATGILVAALFFQMLPMFLLLMVMAYALGVTGGGMLFIVPVALLAMMVAACWLASKRTRRRYPAWPPPRKRQIRRRPVRPAAVALLKTRAERYQELRDVMKGVWR